MNVKLKKAICDWICDNVKEFQLTNECNKHFANYIYDDDGAYLIGGEEVCKFIESECGLIVG